MNIMKLPLICFGILGSVFCIKKMYSKRKFILIELLKKGSMIKSKIDHYLQPKKTYQFKPRRLLITGEHIKFDNVINNTNFQETIQNLTYYTGIINFNLEYSFNNKNYLFIRKNYLVNCLTSLKEFITDISNSKNYAKVRKSNVLSAEISPYNVDITHLIHKVEGYSKDFNSECVFVRDLYHYLKDDNIIINEKNEDQMEIKIIDSFADEHIFKYEDKLIL